jgi:hypothetical protein
MDLCAQEYLRGGKQEHPRKKEFSERYSEAYWKIQRETDIGAFVISDRAAIILADLRKQPKLNWNEEPPNEFYEAECERYKNTLTKIRECARQDLKI